MLTPLHKIILIGVFCLAVVVLLGRLAWRLWSSRQPKLPPRRPMAALPVSTFASSFTPDTFKPAPIMRTEDDSLLIPAGPITNAIAPVAMATALYTAPPPPSYVAPTPVAMASSTIPETAPTSTFHAYAHRQTNLTPLAMVRPDEVTTDESDYVFGPGITPAMASLLPESDERRQVLTKQLQNAGYYTPHAWHNLSAVRWFGIAMSLVVFGSLLLIAPPQFEPWMMAGLVVGPLLAWSMPSLWIRNRAADRLGEIERGMPDMLDLLNMCVGQGMTVPTSLKRVGEELAPVYPALSKELQIVTEQARIGTLSQALEAFSRRVDAPEVHSFTSLLNQTERMGTSVSDALVEYSDNMRESLRQRADQKANTATFKLLFPTVLLLMPAVYLFLLGQPIIELSNFFSGRGREILSRGARPPAVRTLNQFNR